MFGEQFIRAQAVGVEYTTPIIYALDHLVTAYGKIYKNLGTRTRGKNQR